VTLIDEKSHSVSEEGSGAPISVCRRTAEGGTQAQTIADIAGVFRQPDGGAPSQTPVNPEEEFACLAPDDSTVAYSASNGYGLIQTTTGRVTPIDGSFVGWMTVPTGSRP